MDGPILEGRGGDSHRGDPLDFRVGPMRRAKRTNEAPLLAGSVDVEDDLAADAALQESVERRTRFAPGALELDLAVESTVGHEPAEARSNRAAWKVTVSS